ncbi:cell division protease ftsh [Phytophthora cinnamomi]|uniref:cell division protease ftsh n=1 Tax=Phytophthora cinnamomi TaxID=4785 RepID=UPI003559DF48|nr:cell division protease ftsh [Phytophthora cinnamomi]
MSSDHQNASARVVGTAAIFLRPLRYMFDVETDVAIVTEEESTAVLPSFEAVHVHLRAATRPPLMERDELLSGFLRAETPIHSSAVPLQSRLLSPSGPSSRSVDKYKFDLQDSKVESGEDESDDSDRTLSSLRGTYVWLLVRVQPLGRSKPFSFILPDAKDTRETLRVQYQISSSSESFCLPVDHTNVVKLLVTDELINQVDAQMLKFTFLSAPLSVPEPSTAKGVEAKATTPMPTTINYSDTALAASEAAVAEETRRRKQAEAELAEAKSAAQSKDLERLEAQLQAKQDAQRAQELELARNDQLHARSLLEHELAMRDEQNQELQQARKQLEDQLQATNESAQRFQISISSADQALEMLKQRALSDAKEREELQRRLRVLEEEKLALQKKSRACTLQ